MRADRKTKRKRRLPAGPHVPRREEPVFIRVGAVVRKDGTIELLLDERVTSLTIAGPFPKIDPPPF